MSFLGEIKRRNVFKVAAAYAVVSWLLVQVVAIIKEPLNLPDWSDTLVILLLLVGFPIALIFSWMFELTAGGLVREASAPLPARGRPAVGPGQASDDPPNDGDPITAGVSVSASGAASTARSLIGPKVNVLRYSVAVLPFANLSPNPDDAYFAAGLHDEILNQLAKVSALNVIARTSVLQYENARRPIAEIADELNVQTVMEGSVRFAGDRVRVTTDLIEAASGAYLWSETYERPFNDIFAIESDIAMNVANALKAEFSHSERREIEKVATRSPTAYALYLQARNIVYSGGGSFETAHRLLDRAIEIDPRFAHAYGMKAMIYASAFANSLQSAGVDPAGREELEQKVRSYASQAVVLDPKDSNARAALREMNVLTWHWSAFEEGLEPGDEANLAASDLWIYAWKGRPEYAVRLGERIAELNPNDASSHMSLGVAYAYTGDRSASTQCFRRALEIVPTSEFAHAWLAFNEVALGHADTAYSALRLVEQLFGDYRPVVFLPELAYSYARIGRREDAKRLIDEIRSLGGQEKLGAGTLAIAFLAKGDEPKALEQLELVAGKARNHEPDQGFLNVMSLRMNHLADPTLKKPAFVDVLSRIVGD